nr:immunoglobulin heavy chain junction region [Macaca mulatta]MOX62310.1 immunoglobulin heavy chain junction region [Macaca mulatta]MOX64519.1 immunoglobulin heavy chain junction region [Macaca mulatta]MOX66982.1 immunoglobulin heavy chain junction region [Macaca mulatta]
CARWESADFDYW